MDGFSKNILARGEHKCEDNARMIDIDVKLGGRIGEGVVFCHLDSCHAVWLEIEVSLIFGCLEVIFRL